MKALSVIVPCYNSQDYIRRCVDSLLPDGALSGNTRGGVEILIVNDGSTDQTGAIAEEYQKRHPGIVRVIHQENGGHGAAVMTGITHSTGAFIKVVDSDDWVDAASYAKVRETLTLFTSFIETDTPGAPDMVICNFVYEKQGKERKTAIRYANVFPQGRVFGWNETGQFRKGQYLLMHSIIYRAAVLRESGMELPRHTFYVDNLYAYIPLKNVRTLFYLDVDFYHYYIGREGQSVNEESMIRMIDQQLLVNRMMVTSLDLDTVRNKRHRNYLLSYLEIVTMVSSIMLIRAGGDGNLQKKKSLWDFIRNYNRRLHFRLRYGFLGRLVNLPGPTGRSVSVSVYTLSQRIIGFN
ncbi:MAG: glycosyltransferase family 2 protein [Spirochaetaceae bacterium]|jgi:glycosyltransferase involved in cell wall biosynthesis|nr:glycosyltransferase family 2 protein [Spirochaetaceae bacterium]